MTTKPTASSEIGQTYDALDLQVTWLHATWQTYRGLFGSRQGVAALNHVASFSMRVVQDVLADAVLMHIARLTDRASTGGQDNLTLRRLLDDLPPSFSAIERQALEDELRGIGSAAEPLREHRHKRLAHTDYKRAVDPKAIWPGVKLSDVDGLVHRIGQWLRQVVNHYGTDVAFEPVLGPGAAENVPTYVRLGLELERLRELAATGRMADEEALDRLKNSWRYDGPDAA